VSYKITGFKPYLDFFVLDYADLAPTFGLLGADAIVDAAGRAYPESFEVEVRVEGSVRFPGQNGKTLSLRVDPWSESR
jgi:hypothetical protein